MLSTDHLSPLQTLQQLMDNYDKEIVRMVNGISIEVQKYYMNSKKTITEFNNIALFIEKQLSTIKQSLSSLKPKLNNFPILTTILNQIDSTLTNHRSLDKEITTFKLNINNYFQHTRKYIQYIKTQRDKIKKEREFIIDDPFVLSNNNNNCNAQPINPHSFPNSHRKIQLLMKNATTPTITESLIENNSSSKSQANSINSKEGNKELVSFSKQVIEFINELNTLFTKEGNVLNNIGMFEVMKRKLYKQAEEYFNEDNICDNTNNNETFSLLTSSLLTSTIVNNVNACTNTSFNYDEVITSLTNKNNTLNEQLQLLSQRCNELTAQTENISGLKLEITTLTAINNDISIQNKILTTKLTQLLHDKAHSHLKYCISKQQQHSITPISSNHIYTPSKYYIILDKTFGKLKWYLLIKNNITFQTQSTLHLTYNDNMTYNDFIWVPSTEMHIPISDFNLFESEATAQTLINHKIHKYIQDILTYQNKIDKLNAENKKLKTRNNNNMFLYENKRTSNEHNNEIIDGFSNSNSNNNSNSKYIKVKKSEYETQQNALKTTKNDLNASRYEANFLKNEIKQHINKFNTIHMHFSYIVKYTTFTYKVMHNIQSMCQIFNINYNAINYIK